MSDATHSLKIPDNFLFRVFSSFWLGANHYSHDGGAPLSTSNLRQEINENQNNNDASGALLPRGLPLVVAVVVVMFRIGNTLLHLLTLLLLSTRFIVKRASPQQQRLDVWRRVYPANKSIKFHGTPCITKHTPLWLFLLALFLLLEIILNQLVFFKVI